MKKVLFGLAVFLVAVSMFGVSGAQTKPAPLSALIGGAVWTDDHFDNTGGSGIVGIQSVLDADKDFYARVLYHRINVGAPSKQSLDLGALAYWYLGQKWNFYVSPGFEIGLSDGTGNHLNFGVGIERPIFTIQDGTYRVPFSVNGFGEITSTDESTQIMFGVRIAKPVK